MKLQMTLFLAGLPGLLAADPPKEIRTTITRADPVRWQLQWLGIDGCTFFPQVSPARDLATWSFLPIPDYLTGSGGLAFVVDGDPSSESKNFYRLKYTDLDPGNLSGDGIPAIFKINVLGIDPFAKAVSDASGNDLPDAWEILHFGAVNIASPGTVSQPGDGLTNKEKADLGLDPDVNYATAPVRARYQYDAAGRLTGVDAPLTDATYTPDEEGNILTAE